MVSSVWRKVSELRSGVRQVRRHIALLDRMVDRDVADDERRRLAADPDPEVRRMVAQDPHTPATVLGDLVEDAEVAETVAGNPSTPEPALRRLATGAVTLRRTVAANPSSPPDILSRLADDPDELVQFAVAGNRAAPATLLESLGARSERGTLIGAALARNPSSPSGVRERLDDGEQDNVTVLRWRTAPLHALKLAGTFVVARQLANREQRRHPDDPGIAVMGLRAWGLERQALKSIEEGHADEDIVAELRTLAGGRIRPIRRAVLWLRCNGRAYEVDAEEHAHRLLIAAGTGAPVAARTAACEARLAAIAELDRHPINEAFAMLAAREPRLAAVAAGIRPMGGPCPRELFWGSMPLMGLVVSPAYAYGVGHRLPVYRRRIPPSFRRLVDELSGLVGPGAETDDPVLRSHSALDLAVDHGLDLLYPG